MHTQRPFAMATYSMPVDLASWRSRLGQLEAALAPIAQRPVDITSPGWLNRLRSKLPPLDEAGVRHQAEQLLHELIPAYAQGSDELRAALRQLMAKAPSFTWAATLPRPIRNTASFRDHLLLFSLKDQGRDTRDAIVTLDELCHEANSAGCADPQILSSIAALSSNVNRFGMGSTAALLERKAQYLIPGAER